ncbi:MAG: twin-arginine translocase subunit TatC [Halodesulfurarchaeum sp.]
MSRDPNEGSEETESEPAAGDEPPDSDSRTDIVDLEEADVSDSSKPDRGNGETDAEATADQDASGGEDGRDGQDGGEDETDESSRDGEDGDGRATDDDIEGDTPGEGRDTSEGEAEGRSEGEDEGRSAREDEGREASGDVRPGRETIEEGVVTSNDGESGAEDSTNTSIVDRKGGPTSDEEQPLTEHVEEMVKRISVVVVIAGVVSLLAFPYGEEFINFLWYSVLPKGISKPHVYHPLELVITQLKAASLLGVVLALPVFVYETYAFMRPGLYPHERRYYLAAVPTSLVLAFVGLLFGYFLILPAVMTYFLQYTQNVAAIAFALGQTFSLMLVLLGYLAVIFQIPLFVMLAIMMGLTTRSWLEERRLIIWGVFLAVAFLFSPDPTGTAPFLIGVTMIGLFEGTLLLLRWTGRGG